MAYWISLTALTIANLVKSNEPQTGLSKDEPDFNGKRQFLP